jgi:OmpA-OmpF porin, OOP family
MRRLVLIALVCASTALAADPFTRGFDVVPVKPTPTMNSGIAVEGAATWDKGSWRTAAMLDFNIGILALKLGPDKIGDLIPFRTDLHIIGAYQVHQRVEIGVDLPLTVFQIDNFKLLSDNGFNDPGGGVSAFGLGSVRVVPRFTLLDPETFPIGLAAIAELRAPSPFGKSFIGDRGFVFAPRLAAERGFGPVRILANVGYRLRPEAAQYLNLYVQNEFTSAAGVVVGIEDIFKLQQVVVVGEMHLTTPTEKPFTFAEADSLKTPWELLVGIRGRMKQNWGIEANIGKGLGLQSGYGRELLRVMVSLRYDVEVRDTDGDGIADADDGCIDQPEDIDGFQDSDGCPDLDNDNDGVPDKEDGCPMDPGPREYDGCPDRDGDEIPDNVDKCPDEPGPPETEGCPLAEQPQVVLESDRIRLRGNILFETAEATIQKQSYKILDEVYQVLSEHPEISPVLIEGHTDNRGSRPYNVDLSQRRAKSVVDYLVNKGIARKRLKSAGYGFDRPVADNSTPLGRAKNRRTEFKLVKDKEEEGKKAEGPPAAGTVAPSNVTGIEINGTKLGEGQQAVPENAPDAGKK